MTDVYTRAVEAAKKTLEVLQLIGALKDVYEELVRSRKAGKPVRKRVLQLHANLAAVLAADKAQAEIDAVDEEAFKSASAQLDLDLEQKGSG
jgi:hypothetical protein